MAGGKKGGPWGGGGNGNGKSPWGGGSGGSGGGYGGPGSTPPDLEEILKLGHLRFNPQVPGNSGPFKWIVLFIVIVLWLATGIYQVAPEEEGVVLRFGQYSYSTGPGLHYHLPFPIEQVLTPNVTRENREEIGFRSVRDMSSSNGIGQRGVPEESLMLTGDENNIDIHFTVIWNIDNASDYLFNMRDPAGTVRVAAESAMREVVGQTPIQRVLTEGRKDIELNTHNILQQMLDEFGAGIKIRRVKLLKVDPPKLVIDAFNDVQRAKADRERLRNEAEAYRNEIIPKARGEVERIKQNAEAYKQEVINRATGDAKRFEAVLGEYKQAKEVTARRLYFETLEQVMGRTNKVIIDPSSKGGANVLPYLPLDGLKNKGGSQR